MYDKLLGLSDFLNDRGLTAESDIVDDMIEKLAAEEQKALEAYKKEQEAEEE